jgi:hypothetical protein
MKFKVSFAVESGYLGSIIAACYKHPIDEFDIQSAEKESVQRITSPRIQHVSRRVVKRRRKRINGVLVNRGELQAVQMPNGGVDKSTVKDAIYSFVNSSKEPQTMNSIRQALMGRGFNPNSIPSSFQVLRDTGRVVKAEGVSRPQRYLAKGG